MSDFEQVRDAVSDYARDYIRALRHRDWSFERIADQLQVSHVYVQQLLNTDKYGRRKIGPRLEQRISDILHGGSVEALRRAALTFASGVSVVVEHERNPVEFTRSEPPSRPKRLPSKSPR